MGDPFDIDLIAPEVRYEICSGRFSHDMIGLLPQALSKGDRVLVIGAGLGVLATLAAKSGMTERIVALEANAHLIPYIERVTALNGIGQIETVNGVPAHGRTGLVPFFIGHDFRDSSLTPVEGRWRSVMRVPLMDLNLILAEERISLIICDVPGIASHLLAKADLSKVDRILIRLPDENSIGWQEGGLRAGLAARGYNAPPRPSSQRAALFRRVYSDSCCPPCTCGAANTHADCCPGDGASRAVDLVSATDRTYGDCSGLLAH